MCPPDMGFTTVGAEPIAVFCSAGVVRVSWSIADVAADLVIIIHYINSLVGPFFTGAGISAGQSIAV
jgi:hypothetical protein